MLSEEKETLALSLKPDRRRWPAEAWFIPGRTAEVWLRALSAAGVDLHTCEGYVLPLSLGDRSPSGFLLVEGGDVLGRAAHSPAQGYRYLGGRLLIPDDARLCPGLSGREVDAMLRHHHHLAILHPGIGLVGFEEGDRLSVADWFLGWRERETDFGWAHPGQEVQERLYAITAMPLPRVDVLWDGMRDEIGSEPVSELPKTPEEAGESGIKRWRTQMKLRFLEALSKLSRKDGSEKKGGGKPVWRERLEAWTADRMEALRRDQERELKRLLHLLKTDPDEGLKYALPLGGASERGSGPPASKLPQRSTEFDVRHLHRGGSGAPWVVDWQKQYELSRRYRQAANRELRLGRHRRAAYIFAELLKDYREAANVLRQGKHFREASVIYLKHLGDALEGARCLREGGFYLEAIPLFERKKQHETVAELYTELGDKGEAERHYRLAVARCLAHGHTIKAATLLEECLQEGEEAVALLQRTWPKASDAVACLRHELSLYERWRSFEALGARMEAVTADHPPERVVGLMETLVRQARQAPDAGAREVAGRCSFTVAGRWLGTPTFEKQASVLDLVRRLAPEDRLLMRDTIRFQEQAAREARERQKKSRAEEPSNEGPMAVLETHPLPNWVPWAVVEAQGESGLVGLGVATHGVTLLRFRWDGAFQTQVLPGISRGFATSSCRLEATSGALPEVISLLGLGALEPTVFPVGDRFAEEMRIENPPWVESEGFLGMTYGGKGVAWVLRRHGDDEGLFVISSHSSMGDLIATHTIRVPFEVPDGELRPPVRMTYARDQIVFVCGQYLVRYYRDRVETLELEEAPRRFSQAASNRLMMAVSFDHGAEILWGDKRWGRRSALDLPVEAPVITFTRTGDVIAASRDRVDLLGYQNGGFASLHTETMEGLGDPLGIFPTETPRCLRAGEPARGPDAPSDAVAEGGAPVTGAGGTGLTHVLH